MNIFTRGVIGLLMVTGLGAIFTSVPALPAAAQGTATISCNRSTIQIGSGTAGEAYCNLAGFAPNEELIASTTDPAIAPFQFSVGGAGSGYEYIESSCSDMPDTFSVTTTGQTSQLSVSVTLALTLPRAPSCPPPAAAVGMANSAGGDGYWIAGPDGTVQNFGNASNFGGITNPTSAVVAIAGLPSGNGYFLVEADGYVQAFGAAVNSGDMAGKPLNEPIVGMAVDPATGGYWLLGGDGGVFSFNAPFYGSTGNIVLNKPAVGMEATPDGSGYWFVASDGGVFSFNAPFYGSTGNLHLNAPVVGMSVDLATGGYWLDASDGGVFSFNAPFYGSTGNIHLNAPNVGMSAMPDGQGYRFVAADGGIFDFGDALFYGSGA